MAAYPSHTREFDDDYVHRLLPLEIFEDTGIVKADNLCSSDIIEEGMGREATRLGFTLSPPAAGPGASPPPESHLPPSVTLCASTSLQVASAPPFTGFCEDPPLPPRSRDPQRPSGSGAMGLSRGDSPRVSPAVAAGPNSEFLASGRWTRRCADLRVVSLAGAGGEVPVVSHSPPWPARFGLPSSPSNRSITSSSPATSVASKFAADGDSSSSSDDDLTPELQMQIAIEVIYCLDRAEKKRLLSSDDQSLREFLHAQVESLQLSFGAQVEDSATAKDLSGSKFAADGESSSSSDDDLTPELKLQIAIEVIYRLDLAEEKRLLSPDEQSLREFLHAQVESLQLSLGAQAEDSATAKDLAGTKFAPDGRISAAILGGTGRSFSHCQVSYWSHVRRTAAVPPEPNATTPLALREAGRGCSGNSKP